MASIPPMTGTRLPAEEHMLMLPIEPTITARSRPYTPSSHLAGLSVTTDNVLGQAPKFFLPPSASEAEDEGLDMISPCACADDHDGSFTSTRAPFDRSISLCDGSFASTSGPLDRSISLCDVDSQGTVEPFFPEAKRRRSSSYTGTARGPGKVLCFNGPEVTKDKTRSDSGFSESPTPDCQDGPNEVFDKSKTEDPYDEVWLKRLPGFEFTLDESAPLPSPKPTFKSIPASGVQRPVPRHLSPMETVSAPGAVTPAREFNRNLSLESLTSPSPTPLWRRGSARRRSARQASPDAEAVAARLPEKRAGKKRTAWDRMNTISSMDVSMMPVDDGIISGLDVRGDGLAKCGLPVTMTKHRKHDLIRLITPTTLVGLMEGRFSHKFDHYLIVDSRFPFEHQGGHIQGSENLWTMEKTVAALLSDPMVDISNGSRVAIVFHCEFSAHRGPSQCIHLRELDQTITIGNQELIYPELYVLQGGYERFFAEYPAYCTPQQYVRMKDKRFTVECERSENILSRSREEAGQKKWADAGIVHELSQLVKAHGIDSAMEQHVQRNRIAAAAESPRTPSHQLLA